MPQLGDLIEKRKTKSFTKKSYRPWDLSGTSNSLPLNNKELLTNTDNSLASASQEQQLDSENILTHEHVVVKLVKNNKETNRQHLDNKQEAYGEHKDNIKETQPVDIGNKKITHGEQIDNTKETNRQRLDNDSYHKSISFLSGIQEKIFFYIVDLCCIKGEFETGNISTKELVEAANCTYGTAKMSLKRLIDKGLIIRKTGKRSKGGYINFAMTKEVRISALDVKRAKDLMPAIHYQVKNQLKHLDNKEHTNSSSYINKKTITELDEEWSKINITPLEHLGFSIQHLIDIYATRLSSPDIVQESIMHFAFGIENNPEKYKKYPDLLNLFIGTLRKGKAWIESAYVSPREQALKEIVEHKKAEYERMKAYEEELIRFDFEEWKNNLTADEKNEYLLPAKVNGKIMGPETAHLKNHFIGKVWPKRRASVLGLKDIDSVISDKI